MPEIKEFSSHEKWLIQSTLNERYGHKIVEALEVAVELRLFADDAELTECPAMYWEQGKCRFVLSKVFDDFKTGNKRYRTQFFYSIRHHYGTGSDEYKDLGDCVIDLLKLQEKYEKDQAENPDPIDMRGVAKKI